jgi:beta-glucosidase
VITALAAANPRTVLVTLSANPAILPEADVEAVLHAWFPGEQFAEGLADVLTGAAEPGGRLPITFPSDEQATAIETASQYPGNGVARYSEELLVGYRWYDAHGVDPAYPFGFGLGYTTFELAAMDVEQLGDGFRVTLQVRNT